MTDNNKDDAPATRGDLRALRGDMEKMELGLRADMEKMDISLRADMREVSQRNVKELRDEIHADMRALGVRIDALGGRIHALACIIAGSVAAAFIGLAINMFLT